MQLGNDKRQGIPNTSLQKKYGFEQQQQTTTTTTNNNNTNTLSPKCIKIPILGGKMVINYGKLGCNVFMQTQNNAYAGMFILCLNCVPLTKQTTTSPCKFSPFIIVVDFVATIFNCNQSNSCRKLLCIIVLLAQRRCFHQT